MQRALRANGMVGPLSSLTEIFRNPDLALAPLLALASVFVKTFQLEVRTLSFENWSVRLVVIGIRKLCELYCPGAPLYLIVPRILLL